MSSSSRRGHGELESEILAMLWAADEPLTATQVQAALGGELAYTTVLTALSRLYAKELLTRVQVGRAHAYRPVTDEPGLAARRMRQLLDSEQDHQVVLARFVSELSPDDEQVLRGLLGPR